MESLKPHLQYLSYVSRHKWFVFMAGLHLKVPMWQLIIHDWSKFTRAEWTPYANRFFRGRVGVLDKAADDDAFRDAWYHHWTHNPHHWEHWVFVDDTAEMMPERYAREMVADWLGAGRAQTGEWRAIDWYRKNHQKMNLHPQTREFVEALLLADYYRRFEPRFDS